MAYFNPREPSCITQSQHHFTLQKHMLHSLEKEKIKTGCATSFELICQFSTCCTFFWLILFTSVWPIWFHTNLNGSWLSKFWDSLAWITKFYTDSNPIGQIETQFIFKFSLSEIEISKHNELTSSVYYVRIAQDYKYYSMHVQHVQEWLGLIFTFESVI